MGLGITDTTPLDTTDGVFFIKADGAATMDFLVEKDNSATTNSSVATISDDTFLTASFFYNANLVKYSNYYILTDVNCLIMITVYLLVTNKSYYRSLVNFRC